MKSGQKLLLLAALVPFLFVGGCSGDDGAAGPAGPAGADGADGTDGTNGTDGTDGTDGVDGNVSCMECHNNQTQRDITFQYARSQHGLGEYVDYAGGRSSCAKCHSGGGFVEYIETGDVDGNINVPEALNCKHCHSLHTTFERADYALRSTDPVPFIFDETQTADFAGNSNLCAVCHQSRRAEPELTNPGEDTFEIRSTHWGPHHGAQANVLAGVGFAEIEGTRPYPTSSTHLDEGATCVTCHMGEFVDGAGGHTWWPSVASCTECHDGATDFNIGGVQTEMQANLDELRDLLVAAGVVEFVEEDDAYEPVVGVYPKHQARAFFNWVGLAEDRSLGAHNPKYYRALLENSIEAMEAPLP